ncbi:nucleotidyltransferase domain-containing protein, partial [Streptomyces sp. A7024]
MLPQQALIDRVHRTARADDRIEAALMYGSFAAGEGDAHSDIEFWLFFQPSHPDDPAAWLAQVGDVQHLVRNEFGTHVAFFPGLIRGEFHFATADDIDSVRSWPARGAAVERMLVVDRSGKLEAALRGLPEQVAASPDSAEAADLCGRFANWLVLAHHVAARGEYLRAWDALGHVQRHLLWMTRLSESAESATAHWLTPSRAAEK